MRYIRSIIIGSLVFCTVITSSGTFAVDADSDITITATGLISLVAETDVVIEQDSDNVIVATIYINRIYDPNTGLDSDLLGGIGAYEAVVTRDPAVVDILDIRGVSPFDSPNFNPVTGVIYDTNTGPELQPSDTPVAKIVARLIGNCLTSTSLNISFTMIESATVPGYYVPEESSNSLSLLRGDAKQDSSTNIVDAMYIAQYTVGLRSLIEMNPLNGASVNPDSGGDILNIVDAMFIAQYTVGLRDEFFNST